MTLNPNRRTRIILITLLAAAVTGTILAFSIFSGGPPGFQPDGQSSASGLEEKLLLTEFGDFQCPHCARFALIVLPALEQDLIGPGTVQFEYRHYPFLGPESFSAAEASECARDQGRFREYHDELFQLTARGDEAHAGEPDEDRRRPGAGPRQVQPVLGERGETSPRYWETVSTGRNLGVRGTPALFMEGQELRWRDYPSLRQRILEKAESKESKETPASPGTLREPPPP